MRWSGEIWKVGATTRRRWDEDGGGGRRKKVGVAARRRSGGGMRSSSKKWERVGGRRKKVFHQISYGEGELEKEWHLTILISHLRKYFSLKPDPYIFLFLIEMLFSRQPISMKGKGPKEFTMDSSALEQ